MELFRRAESLLQLPLARSLLHETRQFFDQLSPHQRYQFKFAEAKLLRDEENAEAALKLLEELKANVELAGEYEAEILYERARSHFVLNHYVEAANDLNAYLQTKEARNDESRQVQALPFLGLAYRRQGLWDEAMDCYQRSLTITKRLGNQRAFADVLNSLGNLYRLRGEIEQALRACQSALLIRRQLLEEGKTSERGVGLSLNTVGMVYRDNNELAEAERYFQEAIEVFEQIQFKFGLSNAYTNLGYVHMLGSDLEDAAQYFQRAYQIASQRNIRTEQANSANKLGRVRYQQERLDEAIECFQNALELAEQVNDIYQMSENLLGLAMCYYAQKKPALVVLNRTERLARRYNYSFLLGQAESIRGDIEFDARHYRRAFTHYGHACRFMASYSRLKYRDTLRHLQNRLLKVPPEQLLGIADSLSSLWLEFKLDKDFPEFLQLCSETMKYLG